MSSPNPTTTTTHLPSGTPPESGQPGVEQQQAQEPALEYEQPQQQPEGEEAGEEEEEPAHAPLQVDVCRS